jgi:hypothetical protein
VAEEKGKYSEGDLKKYLDKLWVMKKEIANIRENLIKQGRGNVIPPNNAENEDIEEQEDIEEEQEKLKRHEDDYKNYD